MLYLFEHLFLYYVLLLQSNRNYYIYYPSDVTEDLGIAAIRLNQYKAHFHSQG